MQPKIISKERIKPSKATPKDKRFLSQSLLDNLSPHLFVRIILAYLPTHRTHDSIDTTINLLKSSLAKTLIYYYPFAGKLTKEGKIECNDEGIELLEAHMDCELVDLLKLAQIEEITNLFPISGDEARTGAGIDSLVFVQVTKFNCGGMAIGACFSHKIADASSIAMFMNDWASLTRKPNHEPSPEFNGAFFVPPCDSIAVSPKPMPKIGGCSSRRLVFDVSKIDALRNNESLEELQSTRFEAIVGLICKAISRASKETLGFVRPCIVNTAVNLRTRIRTSNCENLVGNFAIHNMVKVTASESNLYELVAHLKDEMAKFEDKYRDQILSPQERSLEIYYSYKELGELLDQKKVEMLLFSSWRRFPFYSIDFGFGEPTWASFFPNPIKNCIFLCDTKDGKGIEAWVSLEDRAMAVFECDHEILSFASVNPSPLIPPETI